MTKGTPSQGLRSRGKGHIMCRRCGKRSYHPSKKVCSACGFGETARKRKYSWQTKVAGTKKG